MLSMGTPVELSKVGAKEFYIPVKNSSGGWIGILRIILIGAEILASFIPGIGVVASAGIAVAGAAAQATLTGISYAQGNIRGVGNLLTSLAIDIIPVGFIGLSTALKVGRTAAITIETVDETLQVQRLERILVRGTSDYKDFTKLNKLKSMRKGATFVKTSGGMKKISRVSKIKLTKYRTAFAKASYKASINESKAVRGISVDEFETKLQKAVLGKITGSTNKDLAILRKIKTGKNFAGGNAENIIEEAIGDISPEMYKFISNTANGTPRQLLEDLAMHTNQNKISSRINRIFAGGESDWSSKQFWKQVKSGKIMKSGNFYTQAFQMGNANDVARELITKPTNTLIRKMKKQMYKWRKKIAKSKFGKPLKYEEKLRREMNKYGKYWGGDYVLGYRIIADYGKTKEIMIHFNRYNTNANTPGSKNKGGKKDIIMPITSHQLHKWNKSMNKGRYYNYHFALSKGGRPIGFEIVDELFANFLSFIPLPALRNILSIVSNAKGVIKDIAKGTYVSNFIPKMSGTFNRLWIHKLGKGIGALGYIGGNALGKEGQRLGLGIAKGFQHSKGQRLGKFSFRPLKDTGARAFKGTALRSGRGRISQGRRTASQTRLSTGRYTSNLRRIGGIFK